MAISGARSSSACATPLTILAAPGPRVDRHTPGLPVISPQVAASIAPATSCFMSRKRMPRCRPASISSTDSPPGWPTMNGVPASLKASASTSTVVATGFLRQNVGAASTLYQARRPAQVPAGGCGSSPRALISIAERTWAKPATPCNPVHLTSGQGTEMATNKKKVLLTESMSRSGRDLLAERGDIEIVGFPNTIAEAEFQALLSAEAPVNAVALGGTRFGSKELEAAGDMMVVARFGVGFVAVDVAALSKRKIPLMVAGTANSPSVAEQAVFMMMALAKRGAEINAMVQNGSWNSRLAAVPVDLFGKTVLVVGFGRIGTRSAKRGPAR